MARQLGGPGGFFSGFGWDGPRARGSPWGKSPLPPAGLCVFDGHWHYSRWEDPVPTGGRHLSPDLQGRQGLECRPWLPWGPPWGRAPGSGVSPGRVGRLPVCFPHGGFCMPVSRSRSPARCPACHGYDVCPSRLRPLDLWVVLLFRRMARCQDCYARFSTWLRVPCGGPVSGKRKRARATREPLAVTDQGPRLVQTGSNPKGSSASHDARTGMTHGEHAIFDGVI